MSPFNADTILAMDDGDDEHVDWSLIDNPLRPLFEQIQLSLTQTLLPSRSDQLWSPLGDFLKSFNTSFLLPDLSGLVDALARLIPENLRAGLKDKTGSIELIAKIAAEDGIPMVWVPPSDVVIELLRLENSSERYAALYKNRSAILEHGVQLVADRQKGYGRRCFEALDAFRDGHFATAQSHAANVVDSMVLELFGKRDRMAKFTSISVTDDMGIRQVNRYLAIRPLTRAFVHWKHDSSAPPPPHFSRHTTAHAAGHDNVFSEANALIAVMLATSLVVQFDDEDD